MLNYIIRKGHADTTYPDSIENIDVTVYGKKDITNGFNHYLLNVGPKIANNSKKIDF